MHCEPRRRCRAIIVLFCLLVLHLCGSLAYYDDYYGTDDDYGACMTEPSWFNMGDNQDGCADSYGGAYYCEDGCYHNGREEIYYQCHQYFSECVPCSVCGVGQYAAVACSKTANTQCRSCSNSNPGQYLDPCGPTGHTVRTCPPCADGQYRSGCGGTSSGTCVPCAQCAAGSQFRSGCGGTSEGQCLACTTTCSPPNALIRQCTPFEDGVCAPCPVGSYLEAQECRRCPGNAITAGPGAVSESECFCASGHVLNADVCEPCAPGTHAR